MQWAGCRHEKIKKLHDCWYLQSQWYHLYITSRHEARNIECQRTVCFDIHIRMQWHIALLEVYGRSIYQHPIFICTEVYNQQLWYHSILTEESETQMENRERRVLEHLVAWARWARYVQIGVTVHGWRLEDSKGGLCWMRVSDERWEKGRGLDRLQGR
jgi:hypothetical protein